MEDDNQVNGDGLALIVSISRGRGFPENAKRFIIKGSIDEFSKDGANINEVIVDHHFGIDLEWIFTEESFALYKNLSSNVVIQIFYFDSVGVVPETTKAPIGVLTFPLDKAVELSSLKNDTMREDLFEWTKLEKASGDMELLCSFTIAKRDDEANESNVCVSAKRGTAQMEPHLPNLLADKGYFLLGDEETSTDLYYFNVFLAGIDDLSNKLVPDFFFSYHLFGIKITLEEFATKEDYRSELASMKIRSNVDNIVTFFSDTVKDSPFRIYLNSKTIGEKIGQAEADWSQLLFKDVNKSKEKLGKGERVSYNGVLPIHKLSESKNIIGKVFVRFSLGTKPDQGLDDTMDASELSVADESTLTSRPPSVPEVQINQKQRERNAIRELEELRQWKQQEKKLFLEKLENIKTSQLKEMSQEWKKQEMEFRKYQEARRNDLFETEKNLLNLIKKYREHEIKLLEKENQKKEEWRKRESMESLSLREAEAQLKKKDTEIAGLKTENKALKAENQFLKEAYEWWKKKLAFPLNQNVETFASHDILQLPKTLRNSLSIASSVDYSDGPKASTEEVKSKLLKTGVYREGDPLIECLTEEIRHGEKKMT